jgi:hypothetical protein
VVERFWCDHGRTHQSGVSANAQARTPVGSDTVWAGRVLSGRSWPRPNLAAKPGHAGSQPVLAPEAAIRPATPRQDPSHPNCTITRCRGAMLRQMVRSTVAKIYRRLSGVAPGAALPFLRDRPRTLLSERRTNLWTMAAPRHACPAIKSR